MNGPGPARGIALPLALVTIAVGLAVAGGALEGAFLFDDEYTVVGASYLQQLSLRALWPEPDLPVSGRPIASLSFALNYALHGYEVWGYHAVNVALHALCGILLFGVVRRTALRPRQRKQVGEEAASLVAFAAALFFLVHPIQGEAVAYVSARTESLMALFYLGTLYCAIRADEEGPRAERFATLAVASCYAGVLTKEAMVSAPLVVFLYDWSFRETSFREVVAKRRGLWMRLGSSWFLLAAIVASGQRSASVNFEKVDAVTYLLNQAEVILQYFRAVVWPHPSQLWLHFGAAQDLALPDVWPQIALLAGLFLASAVALARGSRLGFLGVTVFALLAPTSSFVPIWTEIGSLRRMYLPLAAIATGFVWLGWLGVGRLRRAEPRASTTTARGSYLAATLLLAMPLARVSVAHYAEFASAEVAWRTQTERAPKIPHGWFGLARERQKLGDLRGAAQHYANALLLDPDYLEARANLGNVRLDQGNVSEAIRQYEEALRRAGDDAFVRGKLASAFQRKGDVNRAYLEYERALATDPNEWNALAGLADLLVDHPDPEQRDVKRAVELAKLASGLTRARELYPLEVYAAALAADGRAEDALQLAQYTYDQARARNHRVAHYGRLLERRRREAKAARP